MALAKAGFTVDAVCPPGHPFSVTGALRQMYVYRGLRPLSSIEAAIAAAHPDLLIPCDDLATRHLHEIYERARRREGEGSAICTLIERSMGSPEGFPVVYERTAFMQMAQVEGVRVPKTALIRDSSEIEAWIARVGVPVVLKSNGSSGGEGVRIVQTTEEAIRAFRRL